MKKPFSSFAIAVAMLFSATTVASAQESNDVSLVLKPEMVSHYNASAPEVGSAHLRSFAYMQEKCARLVKSLHYQFPGADNVQYFETADGFYISLTEQGNTGHAYYGTNQKFRYSIVKVQPASLPAHVQQQVASAYPGYEAQGAFRVTQAGAPAIHRVVLQNQKHFVEVLVGGEDMTEINRVHSK